MEPEELQAEYSEDGVDLTLIRWMLTLTPAERIRVLEQRVNSIIRFQTRNAIIPVSGDTP